jgi:hypothetical protein
VCRPGGTIGLIAFRPDGIARDFFETLGRYAPPPPPQAEPPPLWGSEDHVRELFGDHVDTLELTRGRYVERNPDGPEGYVEFFRETFGPIVALRSALAGEPERLAGLDRDLLEFATGSNRSPVGGAAEYPYEYLLVVARTR